MAHRVFREVRKGVVAHTGVSQMLAQNDQLQSWLGANVEEMWPSAVQVGNKSSPAYDTVLIYRIDSPCYG